MNPYKQNLTLLAILLVLSLFLNACDTKKMASDSSNISLQALKDNECDLSKFAGDWYFIYRENGVSSNYLGRIDKKDDLTLNIKFQDNSKQPNFLAVSAVCKGGQLQSAKTLGNHGTQTITGEITKNTIQFKVTSINYIFETSFSVSGKKIK